MGTDLKIILNRRISNRHELLRKCSIQLAIMELKITKSTVEIINSQVVGFGGDALSKGTVLLKLPVAGASNRWKNPGDELVYSVKMENFDGEKMLTLTQTHPRWGNSVDYYAKGRGVSIHKNKRKNCS